MNGFFLAVLGYFLLGVEAVISKFLLTGKIKSWQVYSFYVGMLSFFAFFFAPFGLRWFGWQKFGISFFAGFLFLLAIATLYRSLKKEEASRVFVVFGATSIIATFLIEKSLSKESFAPDEFWGIVLLVSGSFLISFELSKRFFFSKFKETILGGILLSFALIFLQYSYQEQNFVTGYVFSRMGIVFTTAIFFLSPSFRKEIAKKFFQKKSNNRNKTRKKNLKYFLAVAFSKFLAGGGTLLIHLAINFSSRVSVINALTSLQYATTFVLVTFLATKYPKIFQEKLSKKEVAIKTMGVGLVSLGIALVN